MSSALTLPSKLFPAAWIGYGLFWLMYSPSNVNVIAFLVYFGAGGLICWMLAPLKRISLEGDTLLVSNYLKELQVDLSDVEHVSGPENSSHRRIKIQLRRPSGFGRTIIVMPPFFQANEIAEELRMRAGVVRDLPDNLLTGRAQAHFIRRYRNILKGKKVK